MNRPNHNSPQDHSQAGFSLVELAVVLIIIGLIIGGILKGQGLIESARLKSVGAQVNQYRVAVSTFMDRYDAMPGDFANAIRHIRADLKDGNNNGTIEGAGLDATSEAGQFWQHLSAAGLIPSLGETPQSGTLRFGSGAPAAKIGGGFTIMDTPQADMPGHWLVLGKEYNQQGTGGLLTPLQAMTLTKKAGESNPNTGSVRVMTGTDSTQNPCLTPQGDFNTSTNEKVCVVYFQF